MSEPSDELLGRILRESEVVALVGASPRPERDSHDVMHFMQRAGYRVIPVNPRYSEVLGLPCYPTLASIPDQVDMVDLFQRSENVLPFVQPSIDMGVRCFWMQLGIENAVARARLEAAGIEVVENLCTKVEHARFD